MKKSVVTVIIALAVVAAQAQTIFTDPMESAANWTVNATADTSAIFGWDYSVMGIPAAPNTTDGSTLGLRAAANISAAAAHELNAVVTSLNMSGQYTVTFDLWANANGPFPGGGSGSTEFIGGGVGLNGGDAGLDGASLAVTGEGGSSRDWRLYKDKGEQFYASGQYNPALASNNASDPLLVAAFPGQAAPALQQANYAQQTGTVQDGTVGFGWHEMAMFVDSDAGLTRFVVDGLWIGTVDNNNGGAVVDMAGGVGVIYADLFSSVSDNAELSFGVFDNFAVIVPEPSTFALAGLGAAALLIFRRRK